MSSLAKGGRYPELYTFDKDCGATLAVGASCTATMVFNPVTYGLKEASVTLAADDISADGLHKEVLVTATGVLPDATNIDQATATEITPIPTATVPFIDGVQLQERPRHRYGALRQPRQRRDLVPLQVHDHQDPRPDHHRQRRRDGHRAVHRPRRRPVFVQCGVNIDVNLRDKLTFTANANTDYFIRVAREVPPPGDYAIVLKVSLGSPDTMVDVTGFVVSHSTFYPFVDGFGDTVDIRANRLETASASISIYNPSGTRVRILTVPSGTGLVQRRLERQEHGRHPPAGRQVQDRLDRHGHERQPRRDTRYVTISTKKLITKTFTKTLDREDDRLAHQDRDRDRRPTASAYTGGLKLASGANGTVAAAYRSTRRRPSATRTSPSRPTASTRPTT